MNENFSSLFGVCAMFIIFLLGLFNQIKNRNHDLRVTRIHSKRLQLGHKLQEVVFMASCSFIQFISSITSVLLVMKFFIGRNFIYCHSHWLLFNLNRKVFNSFCESSRSKGIVLKKEASD